jgi:hypothetical protein
MIPLDLAFARNYEIAEPPELPGAGLGSIPVHYFPLPGARSERDGEWIKVIPASGNAWVGVFCGEGSYTFSRALSTPNPDQLCVVSGGAAYVVKAGSPERWQRLDFFPVTGACALIGNGLLILATFHKLAALNAEGLAWESPRVCWDDLRITRAVGERIEGTGYDPTNTPSEMHFSVDTKTGRSLLPAPLSTDGKPLW